MSFSCVKHPMTVGEHVCGECGHQFCHECIVFPFGTSRPPLCIACALELGGVRRQSRNRPKLSRRSIRQRLALQRDASRQADATEATSAPEPEVVAPPVFLDDGVVADDLPGGWTQRYP
ncbi:MAG: RING finger protein [Microthrixaceae bacterium]